MASDPAALWRVPLSGTDQAVLDGVFAEDCRRWKAIGVAFSGLVDLGLEGAFVMAFVRELRDGAGPSQPDVAALAAASVVIQRLA